MNDDLFLGTSGPRDAKIAIVGEAYGATEARKGYPFCGKTGEELDKILPECNLNRDDIFCTNVVNEQPFNNDIWRFFHPTREARAMGRVLVRGLYPCDNILLGLEKLHQQLDAVKPDIIIGFGNYTLWALTENSFNIDDDNKRKVPRGITAWRGSQLYTRDENIPFMPTFHPASVFRNWPWRYTIKHDLSRRLPKVFKPGGWQEPKRDFIIRPTIRQTMDYIVGLVATLKTNKEVDISVDIETRGGHIACVGIGYSFELGPPIVISIPFMCAENPEGYWTEAEEAIIVANLCYILTHPNARIMGQFFLFDAQYFAKWWAIVVKCDFDTMMMHHVCWPGTPMGLCYLSSLYCDHHVNWKDEGKIGEHEEWGIDVPEEQLWEYNCIDVVKTAEIKYVLVDLIKKLGLEFQAET